MGHFLPFYLPNSPKNQNFTKISKKLEISSFYTSVTKIMIIWVCCSWDMVYDRCNCYFSFRAIFCPFTPLAAQKIKIFKKFEKCLEISFYICVPKIMTRWCMVPEIRCVTDVIVISHFGLFFALLPPPNSPKNQNFEKIKKIPGDIIILHMCSKNYGQRM